MIKIAGIDVGNYATKSSEGIVFESKVSVGHKRLNKNDIKIIYNGKKYTVGNKKGAPNIGDNKYYNEYYDICLLTAIAKSFVEKYIDCKVVVGLPPAKYNSSVRNDLLDKLNKLGRQELTLIEGPKEISKTIIIKEADVFCENAPVFMSPQKYRDIKSLWIDIGGGTGDISEFNGLELIKHDSTENGMLSFYKDMKLEAQSKLKGKKLDIKHMEEMFNKDIYTLGSDTCDISFLKDIIENRIMEFTSDINQNFDTTINEINIIGGGAEPLIEYFKKEYKNARVPEDNQFLNALTYKAVGKELWDE